MCFKPSRSLHVQETCSGSPVILDEYRFWGFGEFCGGVHFSFFERREENCATQDGSAVQGFHTSVVLVNLAGAELNSAFLTRSLVFSMFGLACELGGF